MDWKDPKTIAAGISAAGLIGVGALALTHAQTGDMRISQDAADIANKQIDRDTTEFYGGVCRAMSTVTSTPNRVLNEAEDSVGKKPDEVAAGYKRAFIDVSDTLENISSDLSELDKNAPIVTRADGHTTDFTGAVTPVREAVDKQKKSADTFANRFDHIGGDQEVVNQLSNEALQSLSDGTSEVMDSMGTLKDTAPIYSEATQAAIVGSGACGGLMGGDFSDEEDKDIVVDGVVSVRVTAQKSHDETMDALTRINFLGDMRTAPPEDLHETVTNMWRNVRDKANSSAEMYDQLDNPYDKATPEFRATRDALDEVSDSADAYRQIASTADDILDKLSAVDPSNPEGLSDVLNGSGDAIRNAQVRESRAFIHATTRVPMPTQATADKVKKQTEEAGVDEHAVSIFEKAKTADSEVAAAMQHLSEVGQALQGTPIDEAGEKMAQPLDNLAQAAGRAHEQAGGDELLSEVGASAEELENWAYGAASRIRGASPQSLQDTIESVMNEVNTQTGAVGTSVRTVYEKLPYGGQETQQKLADVRQRVNDQFGWATEEEN